MKKQLRRYGLLLAASIAAMATPALRPPFLPVGHLRTQSPLPFQAPRFDQIHDSDFLPAFEQGMAEQSAEIARIANNPAPPTFGNTLIAMERSGRMLQRTQAVFSVLSQTDANPERLAIQKAVAPKLAAHSDAIYLNPKLFARVKQVYDQRSQQHLDPEQQQLLKVVYQRFIRAGRAAFARRSGEAARHQHGAFDASDRLQSEAARRDQGRRTGCRQPGSACRP